MSEQTRTMPHYHTISSGQGAVAGDSVFAKKGEADAAGDRLHQSWPDARVAVRECLADACAPSAGRHSPAPPEPCPGD